MPTIYDLESFPNAFTGCFIRDDEDQGVWFEISSRRRDNHALWQHVASLDCMIGFNNFYFDWPLLNFFMSNPHVGPLELYEKCQAIIMGERFDHVIWNPAIPQIDLFLIHHFNNRAKATSLKKLQFNMRSTSIQGLPFEPGTYLSDAEIDILLCYNGHDTLKQRDFYRASLDKIALREAIEPDWMNQSDTGLGRKFFERELNGFGVPTRARDETGRNRPIVTMRPDGVRLKDVIFPYIRFTRSELAGALDFFKKLTVRDEFDHTGRATRLATWDDGVLAMSQNPETGEEFEGFTFALAGVPIVMGLGGIHGSLDRKVIEGCDILDLDVTSFYPNIAIKNGVFPAHLGPKFCEVYQRLLDRRLTTPKGSPENTAIKLALNSVFGSAGSIYTPFYDPAAMLGITINGQFLILSLAELLLTVPGLRLIQLNTDGITVTVPDGSRPEVERLYKAWSAATLMPLEATDYARMWMRDVNNYVAEKPDGKRKLKGAYQPDKEWHQNASMPVVRAAAVAVMCDGAEVEEYLRAAHERNPWDFMLRLDLSRSSHLLMEDGTKHHGVVRYYVSERGQSAVKIMPATRTRIHGKGHAEAVGKRGDWKCSACSEVFKRKADWEAHADAEHSSKLVVCQMYNGEPLDYDMRFYASEVRKLLITERF